jgi:DNA-binding MarR family transcriptional regulator
MTDTPSAQMDAIAEARRQWLAHGWKGADAMAAATSIVRAHQLVLARIDAALRPFGLTFARYEALVLLHFSRVGSLPLGKMGERLMVHPTSITNSINRLEAEGLVERVAHDRDGRMTLARITADGRDLVARATRTLVGIEFGLAPVAERDIAEMTALTRRLRVALGDLNPGAGPATE